MEQTPSKPPTMQERVDTRAHADPEFAYKIAHSQEVLGHISLSGAIANIKVKDETGVVRKEGQGPYADAANIAIGQSAADRAGERILRAEDRASTEQAQQTQAAGNKASKRILHRLLRPSHS